MLKNTLILKGLLTIWVAIMATQSFAKSISVKDDLGNLITLIKAPEKIVSLAPHNTEILFAVGAGKKIVGTVSYSDYPKEALEIPRIGGYDKINLEQVIAMQPDLIVAWFTGNDSRVNKRLQELGFPVYYSEPSTLIDIANSMAKLGTLTGYPEEGARKKDQFLERYKYLKNQNSKKEKLKIYYEVWQNPRYTLGGSHFSQELFTICGGTNIFSDVKEKAPIVSLEAILTRNPDVILRGDQHGEQSLEQLKNEWKKWPGINAVKNNQIHYVDAAEFTRSSPRAIEAADDLCKILDEAR